MTDPLDAPAAWEHLQQLDIRDDWKPGDDLSGLDLRDIVSHVLDAPADVRARIMPLIGTHGLEIVVTTDSDADAAYIPVVTFSCRTGRSLRVSRAPRPLRYLAPDDVSGIHAALAALIQLAADANEIISEWAFLADL
jgi:hypothetical protein